MLVREKDPIGPSNVTASAVTAPSTAANSDLARLGNVTFASFPAVPAGQRRGRSTSISGPPPRVTRRPDDNALDSLS